MDRTTRAASTFQSTLRWLPVIALLMLLPLAEAKAQSSGSSVTDGTTPLGLTPGAPAGSYALSGFENVNPYNGNLNFALPLLHVGGRGGVQHTIPLKIEQRWRTIKTQQTQFQQPYYYPTPNSWQGIAAGYGPGVMTARVTGVADMFSCPETLPALTRLTFTAGDGTEYEFRDVLYDGLQKENLYSGDVNFCDIFLTTSRGRVFKTFDGSAMTFISDTDISDFYGRDIKQWSNISGYMLMRDGTRYRIELGFVQWIQDRNGNRMTFHYNTFNDVDIITDSLNRLVTIHYSYEYTAPDPHALYDEINYKGFGGTTRSLKVWYKKLKDCLRVTQPGDSGTPWKYGELFPEIQWADGDNKYNPWKVSSVQLADGRQYQFYYNVYGELARVVMPTGGAFEYDYLGGDPTGPDSGGISGIYIYRRVIERRVYADGTQLENQTTFERPVDDGVSAEISVTVKQYNNVSVLMGRSKHFYHGSPLDSFLWSITSETNYSKWQDGKEWKTETFDTDSTIKQRVTSAWVQGYGSSGLLTPPNDPRISNTITTLTDTNQASKQEFDYDGFSNKTEVREYDFGANGQPGTLLRKTHTSYVVSNGGVNYTTVNPNTTNPDASLTVHVRSLPLQQSVFDGPTSAEKARTIYEYDNYTQGVTDRSDISGHARTLDNPPAYTSTYITRGNATQVTRVVFGSPDVGLSTRMQYDIAGNVRSATDPKGNTTTFEFNDRYGSPDNEAESNTVPSELSNPPRTTYAFATKVTNALTQNAYTQYDYYLGKPVNSEDSNNVVSSGRYGGFADGSYTDSLDRATELIVAANVSSLTSRTRFTYNDSSHLITTQSDQATLNDGVLTSAILYDGLGRTTETRTSAPEGTIYTTQQYDAMGRVSRTYNPYRATNDPTYGYADTTYDGIGRVLTVTTSDGAMVATSYSGNATTVTDQATRQRRSITDGLGRLIRVDEPDTAGNLGTVASPTQPTSYVYDVLDDLAKVTQGGQTRYFMYDSLKRLIRARNPEQDTNTNLFLSDPLTGNSQWSLKYVYDENSNLLTRTDSRGTLGITTTYVYDALNRVTNRTYTNDPQNTLAVSYKYDGQTLPTGAPSFTRGSSIGRLVALTYGTGSAGSYQGYDQLGRVNVSYQQTDSINYGFGYGYNLASEMTSETYPSGRQVITEYDSAGRAAGIRSAAIYYAGATATDTTNRIQYAPQGAVSVMKMGNGKWEHTNFNNRLQPTQIGLGTSGTDSSVMKLDYGYGTTSNNGNVTSQTITIGSTVMNQSYGYDALNRLQTATETGAWTQTYDCDRFGNRAVRVGSFIPTPALTPQSGSSTDFSAFNQGNNRIQSSEFGYDASGNLKNDPTTAVNAMLYDAENHQVSYTKAGTTTYSYDGDGHRVKKVAGSVTTIFVYNALGQLTAEYRNDTTPPVGGGGTSYLTSDHLGSTRVVTKSDGTVKARYDYLPFGEDLGAGVGQRTTGMGYSAPDSTKQKFTQKERDSESGMDYFLARYYASAQGRFTSADEPLVGQDIAEPQSWNLYAYASNNPLNRVDPDGERWFYKKADDGKVTDVQWVNPNDDGSYTSPGKGWIEFVPTKSNPVLEVFSADGTKAYHFWETSTGGPGQRSYWTGKVEDATMGLVADYLLGKAIGTIAKEAFGAWRAYRAAKALEEVAEDAAERAARQAPKGRLGNPMKVAPRTNAPRTIGGRQYTGHALDQMQGRGLTPSVVEDTIARGAKTPGRGGATVYTTEQAKIVVNPNGSVKTVMPH